MKTCLHSLLTVGSVHFLPALILALLAFGLGTSQAALPAARDATFQTLSMDGLPNSSVLLSSGKILIGGNFQTIGGTARPAFARLNGDGTLDGTFAPPIGGPGNFGKPFVNEVAVLPDGKIIVAGWPSFRTTGAILRTNIIRFNADGTVDAGFDAKDLQHFKGLGVQADGKIIINAALGLAGIKPVRLNMDGSVDGTFNYTGAHTASLFASQFTVQSSGLILGLAGDNDPSRGGNEELFRLTATGAKDATFKYGPPFNPLMDDSRYAVSADGKIMIAGLDNFVPVITRLAEDGTRDAAFTYRGAPNNQGLYAGPAAWLPDGGAIAVRQPTAGDRRLSFLYLTPDGKLAAQRDLPNSAFDNGVVGVGTLQARAFAMQPDGKLLFAAAFLDGIQNTFGMFRMPTPPVPTLPTITQQPAASTSIGAGESLFLGVTAASESPLTYQWVHGGTNLVAQTNNFLNLGFNSPERPGTFLVIVGNSFGAVTSQVATVTVRAAAPPVMTQQPVGAAVKLSQAYSLTAQCQTEVTVRYQWYKNGVPFAGGSGESAGYGPLNLPANDSSRAGDYFVVFTNSFGGAVTSVVAHIDLILPGPPTITVQPADLTLFATQPVQLAVNAVADGVIQYRWMREGTNLTASGDIPSVTGASLYVNARVAAKQGDYAVVLTVTPGGSVTSRVARVTILPSGPPVFLSQPGSLSLNFGDRASLTGGFNGEAPVTATWWKGATNVQSQNYQVLDAAATNSLVVLGVPAATGDYRLVLSNRFGAVTSAVAGVTVKALPAPEIRKDLADATVAVGEFNTLNLVNGLVVTNCCSQLETAHVLALTPTAPSLAPFTSAGTWHLAFGASNLFYASPEGTFPAITGKWGFVPGAAGFTGILMTNFPTSGVNSRLETFDDGRYALSSGATGLQNGTLRVLGPRRPATNVFSVELYGSNNVILVWYKDGAPIDFGRNGNGFLYTTSEESLGVPPVSTGVNRRYKLTIPDVRATDAGKFYVVLTTSVANPDTTFGAPAFLTSGVSTGRVATLTLKGFAEELPPQVTSAIEVGHPSALDEPTALAVLADNSLLLANRRQIFGAGSSTANLLTWLTPDAQTNYQATLNSENLNGGTLGSVTAVVPDNEGGAVIGGHDGQDGWFLRRVRAAVVPSGTSVSRTFTNLWTARVVGPFTNGFDNLSVPKGAEVIGLLRTSDGVVVAGTFIGKSRFGSQNVVTNPALPLFTAQVGGITLTNFYDAAYNKNDRSKDIYIAKYDWAGQLAWIKQFGGTNNETVSSLSTDSAGNLFLAGSFTARVNFGNLPLDSSKATTSGQTFYGTDGFVTKLDPNGNPIWARAIGASYLGSTFTTQIAAAIADGSGGVYFAANRSSGIIPLQPGLIVGPHFLGRLNPNGEIQWTQDFQSVQGNTVLALDAGGNLVLADTPTPAANGTSVVMGAATLNVGFTTGTMLAKFAPTGTLIWQRALDSQVPFLDDPRIATVLKAALAPNGELVLAGRFPGGTQGGGTRSSGQRFDGWELTSTNNATANPTEMFLVRLAPSYAPALPRFSVTPAAQSGLLQDRMVLEGRVEGNPTPSYQWFLNGGPVVGATNRILVFAELARTNQGSYVLVASNALGVTSSAPVQVTAELRPTMTGWTMVTSTTNYLGSPTRVTIDEAGRIYTSHYELARGNFNYLDCVNADGTFAWRFAGTWQVDPKFSPVLAPDGAVYLAGTLQNRPTVARLNPETGAVLWTVSNIGTLGASIAGFDVDRTGSVRLALSDKSLRRYDPNGKEISVVTLAAMPFTITPGNSRLAFGPDNGFYFYGNRVEALNLGGTNMPALGGPGAQTWVLARYDAAGTFLWYQSFGGSVTSITDPFRVMVDGSGDAIIAGSFGVGNQASFKYQFGTNQLSGFGYAAKVGSNGVVKWAKAWWLHVDDAVLGVDGAVHLTGWLRTDPTAFPGDRRIRFGTNVVAAGLSHDQFVAKLSSDGGEQWIKQTGSTEFATFDNARDYYLSINSKGVIAVAGFALFPPASAALDFGSLRYLWPDLRPYNIGNGFGNLSTYYIARLEEGVAPPAAQAQISFAPPAPGATSFRLTWPAGFILQKKAKLVGGAWETVNVNPPFDASILAAPQGYFRVVPQP